jgi:predicted ATPase/class 3 adenylate cyclase/DNA-binding CsgD family transcriptional regulator
VLRALREARGITRAGWAAHLGYSPKTVQRWERGAVAPDAAAEAALLALCAEQGLFRRFDRGVLQGLTVSPEWLTGVLADARLGSAGAASAAAEWSPAPTASAAATLPTGTLTFLFTDVEGSTRLWEDHPPAMRQVMARHDALLTEVFEQHDGVVVRPRGEGDSLFCVFVRASDAVAAARAGQHALAAEEWGEIGPLRVRMGLHTGEADLRAGDYYGAAVNRCARIRAAGHGGQILLSQATAQLVRAALPQGAGLLDLGRHRLKDLAEPEQLYQLVAPGLLESFPPLATLDARPNNLPLQLTSFVGRGAERAALAKVLRDHRLVTLTGPGGAGKTRLAVQVAAEALDDFPDGVFFVDLAPLTDAARVVGAIAGTVGVRETTIESLSETLRRSLRDKRLLLVLDNFEHLLAAAPVASALVQGCPALTALVTSREPLGLRGEQRFPVEPLALAPADGSGDQLLQSEAVQLFVERARARQPDFALTTANGAAVAAICTRLDGLPLAIELAAARVLVLPPPALLARLDQRLALLTGGGRDLPARHQTLRNALAWSHDLLTSAEQRLFRRLAVFVGGCTLEAVAVVCNAQQDLGLEVLDGVTALIERSLVRQEAGVDEAQPEPRFVLLETVREYARERLDAAGESDALARQHAEAYVAFAERAEPQLMGPEQAVWLRRLASEYDNLHAALAWCAQQGEAELEVRLAVALPTFWRTVGRMSDGARVLERVVALAPNVSPALRARALLVAGAFAESLRDLVQAQAHLEASLRLYRELGDQPGVAAALHALGDLAEAQGDVPQALALLEESLALRRQLRDEPGIADSLRHLSRVAQAMGDLEQADTLLGEALAINEALGDRGGVAATLSELGWLAQGRRQPDQAIALFREAGAHFQALGYQRARANALVLEGLLHSRQGDHRQATACLLESLALSRAAQDTPGLGWCLTALASVIAGEGATARAARLFGAGERVRDALGLELPPEFQRRYERAVAMARDALGDAAFTEGWAAGRALPLDQAVAEALTITVEAPGPEERSGVPAPPVAAIDASDGPSQSLSAREAEVLRLVATGKSNREIAEMLSVSPNTVAFHIKSIFNKTGVSNRTEAASYAHRHGLVNPAD